MGQKNFNYVYANKYKIFYGNFLLSFLHSLLSFFIPSSEILKS